MKAHEIIIEIHYEAQTTINYVILMDSERIDKIADKIETLINEKEVP